MPRTPARPRTLYAVLDLLIVTALVGSYIWWWRSESGYERMVLAFALLAWSVWLQRVRDRGVGELVGRIDTFYPAIRQVAAWVVPPILAIIVLAIVRSPGQVSPALPALSDLAARLATLIVLGLLQQYLLLAHLWRSACDLSKSELLRALIAAAIFALLHAPNPFLMALTLIGGLVACRIYRRNPNLIALAIGHGCLSFAVYYGLPRVITGGLRFGPGYG